jgi:hypothetical protein
LPIAPNAAQRSLSMNFGLIVRRRGIETEDC